MSCRVRENVGAGLTPGHTIDWGTVLRKIPWRKNAFGERTVSAVLALVASWVLSAGELVNLGLEREA